MTKEIYQQIANSHVQQVMAQKREQEIAALQADFAAFQEQQKDPEALMADFNNFMASQQPASQAPTQTPKQPVPALVDYVNMPGNQYDKKKNAETIAKIYGEREQKRAAKEKEEADRQAAIEKARLEDYQKQQQAENILASSKKKEETKKEEKKVLTAGRYDNYKGTQKWNESVNDTVKMLNSKDMRVINDYQNAIHAKDKKAEKNAENIPDDIVKDFASRKGVSFDEAKKIMQESIKKANTQIEQPGKLDENLTPIVQAAKAEELRKANQRQQNPYEAFLQGMGNAVTAPVRGPVRLAGAITGNKDLDILNEYQKGEYANAQEQHKLAVDAGNLAGMLLLAKAVNPGNVEGATATDAYRAAQGEALLNGANAAEATRLGLSIGGRQLASNVAKQMPFDLATDIIPTLANDIAEGKSGKQIMLNTLLNTGLNAGFNGMGEAVALAKDVKRGIPNLSAADDVVEAATKQANEAAQNIESLAKQIPETPAYRPSEDELKALYEDMYQQPAAKEEIEALNDEMGNMFAGPKTEAPASITKEFDPEVEEKIFSDFDEIYRSMDSMNQAAIDSRDAKVMEKFEKLQKSVFDYEEKIWKSGDTDEINKAKKAADAARQGFIRQMKKIDPSYTGELTGTKLGNAEYRLPQTISDADAEEMVNGWVKEEMANPNRFVEDVSKRNVPGANQLQFFAEKNNVNDQLTELEKRRQQAMLDINEQARQAVLNENPEVARFSDPESDLRRLASERAYREEQLNKLKTPEEKEDEALDALTNYVNSQRQTPPPGGNGPTRNTVEDVARNMPEGQRSNIPPSPPTGNNLAPEDQWKTSKWRTNTAENQGWGDNLPMKDYAYRVFTEAEQRAAAVERYSDIENVYSELMHTDQFDEIDVKMAMSEMQRLMDEGTPESLRQARMLGSRTAAQGRESGRAVQAFAEYNRNTAAGALTDANKAQEDLILEPWKSRNVKQREGNSRIAKALADMGNKWRGNKVKPELTHEQIKQGVKAEIEREMGSVEGILNDNDLEFLTIMAEDKSIPVWQITDEIEHRLNTGSWYTLDESIELPKKLNTKLNNALKSLIETDAVRPEPVKPDLKQIRQEVVNTLGKESADFEGLFNDDDVDYLANLINNGATKDELSEALNMKMATGSWGISDETIQEVNNIFKQISQYDPNSKQFVEGQAEAYRLLANEIVPDATPLEKFEAWRYIAMLGNPKTMLRNFIGNQTFAAVTGISNNIAAVAEAGIDKGIKALGGEGIQRTKSVLNPISDSGLIKAAAEDADASRYRQMIGSKYEKMDKDALRRSKSVFKSKLAQFYEKVTDAGISDYQAVKNKFSTSLAGYLKANGYDTNIFKAEDELQRLKNLGETRLLSDVERAEIESLTKDVEALNKARDYALKQAEYATFHEDNVVANLLTKFSREARSSDKLAAKALGTIVEGVVPFKKTPANVLKSGLEYSPLGAIKSIKETGKLVYENTGKRAGQLADTYVNKAGKEIQKTLASDVIDSWAKTLTGTGLTALGFYLYDKGIIHSSNPDTKYQDELEGHQNYSIEINGKSYTIDWAAPTVMPLMVGAEMAKLWDSNGKGSEDFFNNIDDYVAAANRLADPLVETSMLSGVKDTLETAANAAQYNENLNIPALAIYNALTGYATQGVPTISGQIARTVDPTRRSTYTDKEGVSGIVDKQIKKQMNKIPGLSTLNQPYVDTYGREKQNSPFGNPAANLAYQMFSPGYLTDINETNADKISREAYEVGKTAGTLPKWQSSFKDADNNRVSPEDYYKAAKAYGEANYNIRDALANDEWFNSLDGPEKEEIVKGINTIAEHTGKAAIDPEYATTSKPYTAYKEGGINGLMEYYKGEAAKNTAKELLGDSGVTLSSNAGKAVKAAVESGDMAKAEKLAQQAKEEKAEKVEQQETKDDLSSYGLTKTAPAKTYEKAQSVIPGLTTEKFATTYKKIDSDGNQGIKQDEIIDYLNKNNISEAEGKKIWNAYGNSTWKKIPKLENGKWKKIG